MNNAITIPLLVLAAYVAWTMLILLGLFLARTRHLAAGGSVADFGLQDSSLFIYRLSRTHINCVENLPLYIGVMVLISFREVSNSWIDSLSVIYMIFRIAQSIIHIFNLNSLLRFSCLLVQIVCLFGLLSFGLFG